MLIYYFFCFSLLFLKIFLVFYLNNKILTFSFFRLTNLYIYITISIDIKIKGKTI